MFLCLYVEGWWFSHLNTSHTFYHQVRMDMLWWELTIWFWNQSLVSILTFLTSKHTLKGPLGWSFQFWTTYHDHKTVSWTALKLNHSKLVRKVGFNVYYFGLVYHRFNGAISIHWAIYRFSTYAFLLFNGFIFFVSNFGIFFKWDGKVTELSHPHDILGTWQDVSTTSGWEHFHCFDLPNRPVLPLSDKFEGALTKAGRINGFLLAAVR